MRDGAQALRPLICFALLYALCVFVCSSCNCGVFEANARLVAGMTRAEAQ